jgi:hypothetical protein
MGNPGLGTHAGEDRLNLRRSAGSAAEGGLAPQSEVSPFGCVQAVDSPAITSAVAQPVAVPQDSGQEWAQHPLCDPSRATPNERMCCSPIIADRQKHRISETHPDADAASLVGPGTGADQRLCWSAVVWSPPPESNRRHHPYHESRQWRCAAQGLRSSAKTVRSTCMGSVIEPGQLIDDHGLAVLEDFRGSRRT